MATGLDGFGAAGEFAVEDLERMPDDGYRYELTPSLQALDLVAGRYVEVRCPSGEQAWQAKRPSRSPSPLRLSWQACASRRCMIAACVSTTTHCVAPGTSTVIKGRGRG